MKRPKQGEYNPYYETLINRTKGDDFAGLLKENTAFTVAYFNEIDVSKLDYKYAEGKWTIKEVLMHLIDTERGYAYRALICIRGDNKLPLYPLNEDLFAANVDVSHRSMESLLDEFLIVRKNTSALFESVTEEQSRFVGNGTDHKITARALGYIMIGHILHHINVINERYL